MAESTTPTTPLPPVGQTAALALVRPSDLRLVLFGLPAAGKSSLLGALAQTAQPLFLTASFYAPHPPLFPPKKYFEAYLKRDLPAPAHGDWVDWAALSPAGASSASSSAGAPLATTVAGQTRPRKSRYVEDSARSARDTSGNVNSARCFASSAASQRGCEYPSAATAWPP